MTKNGVIENYTVHIVSKNFMTATLTIRLTDLDETITVDTSGTLQHVCTKLNTIPIGGKLTGKYLINAGCTVERLAMGYRLVSVDGPVHKPFAKAG